jgi:glycosyltransferase involved in cell wall biosynthesis
MNVSGAATGSGAKARDGGGRRAHRLAFVSDAVYPFNPGGKERRLHEVATRLARRGHEVHIFTMNWWGGPRHIVRDGMHFHALIGYRPLYRGARRSTTQALLFGLATLKLARWRFDAVDVDHMPFFPLFAMRLVCWARRTRFVATWHEVWGRHYWVDYLGRVPGCIAYLVERFAVAMPDEIVAVSPHTARRLRQRLRATCPVTTVPLGVDLERLDAVAPAVDRRPDVLFAGRLLANKNVDLLLAAVRRAGGRLPGLRCLVVGEGPERERLERLAVALRGDHHVEFSDFLPGDDIYRVMKAAGVLVLPSSREGFGLVVVEASACGTPVVTVRHPDNAAAALVASGVNGVVSEPDPDALADAIVSVLAGRETFAPRRAVEAGHRLDWARTADGVLEVLTGARPADPGGSDAAGAIVPNPRTEAEALATDTVGTARPARQGTLP